MNPAQLFFLAEIRRLTAELTAEASPAENQALPPDVVPAWKVRYLTSALTACLNELDTAQANPPQGADA